MAPKCSMVILPYAYVPQLFALLHVNSHGEIDFEIMETYIERGSNFR